ncbi:MAG TPA: DUF3307 domain-containing protein [Methylomirabilota bacterium]|nr:DUF3307 domain-containing protein [Methylomirabilota bacterium]
MMPELLCHLIGDYILQSDWMATNKSKRSWPCLVHVLLYGLPFLFLSPSLTAMLVIIGTHFVIDRFWVGRLVAYWKNWILSLGNFPKYADCPFGYQPDRPIWLTVWLMIITDNTLHLLINYLALKHL